MRAILLAVGLGALYVAHALHYTFLQDDAYIFLRYAEHIHQGYGPVWNVGERVEGYTSPLWLATLVAVGGVAPQSEMAIHCVTLALGAVALLLTYRLGLLLSGSAVAGTLAAVLLASDRSFAVWSTSGMETRLYGCLALAVALAAIRVLSGRRATRDALWLGGCMWLVSLARPEGLLLSALALGALLLGARRPGIPRALALAAGLFGGGILAHLALRLWYYGQLLPNTFYAKVTGFDFDSGARYLLDFGTSFPHVLLAAGLALPWVVARSRDRLVGSYVAALPPLYVVYLLAIGGDFMEFRMLDVLLPFVYACTAAALVTAVALRGRSSGDHPGVRARRSTRGVAIAAAACLLAGNLWFGLRFDESRHTVMPRRWMAERTTHYWVAIGHWLGRIAEEGESVATTAAGAIPYLSRLPAVDMHGLNDATISRLPPDPTQSVGHRRVAPPEYLRERGITFVLGHPDIAASPQRWKPAADRIVVRVEHGVDSLNGGRPFYLRFSTTGDRDTLVTSLRGRGVTVLE